MVNEQSVPESSASSAEQSSTPAPTKAPRSRRASAKVTSPAAAPEITVIDTEVKVAPVKKAPVRRSRSKIVSEPEDIKVPESPTAEEAVVKAPVKRATRRRATSPVTAPASVPASTPVQSTSVESAAAQDIPAQSAPVEGEAAKKAPVRRRTTKQVQPVSAVEGVEAVETSSVVEAAEETVEVAAPKATRSRRKPVVKTPVVQVPVAEVAVVPVPVVEAAVVTEEEISVPEITVVPEVAQTTEVPQTTDVAPSAATSLFLAPDSGMSALFLAPDLSLAVPAPVSSRDANDEDETDGAADSADNRRGRGRNRNRRSNRAPEATVESDSDSGEAGTEDGEDDGVTSRRRRRRRRGEQDLELTGGSDEDPPNTVTRVRAPRTPAETSSSSDRVTSLRGSTRLEAKKQRRRDSRDSGRRRTVITEAEFLARRESVDRVMVVRQNDERIQIGVLEDGILAEHFVSKTQQDSLIGNVYLGKVQNVLPSMEAAFVDIGRGRNAVLYAGEVDWDGAELNGQPRRIENALKSGDAVLVQVSKDPVGHKGARLTSQISLPGRYLVYVPGGSMTGISRKLPDVERNRLKRVLKDHLPENAGVIVRTAAEGASEEELTNDINRLRAQWEGISTRATSSKSLAPEMLYGEPDLTIKVVRDVFNEDFTKLIVSGEEAWDTIEAYVTYVAPDLLDRLEKWDKTEDIFAEHRIDEQISKALERKVFLPSGGSLVIDRTEAMTVVDVNTGKFTGSGGNLEETVTKNNLEAAEEVVRQLRLRDIGGIIVIDFIDMVLESNRDLVLRRMVECLGRDRTKHQVAEVTSLGLVQMTRKRMGTGLLEVFGEQCEACAGRGMVTHEIPVEHRRVHTVASDSHQSHAAQSHPAQSHAPQSRPVKTENRDGERTANRSTRSERKRNRNRSQQQDSEQPQLPEVVQDHVVLVDEQAEAEKALKATAARAALANIAAAAAASHHEVADVADAAVQSASSGMGDTATLTFGGEAIELPRGHHLDTAVSVDRAEQLAGLSDALDQLSVTHDEKLGDGDDGLGFGSNRQRSRRGRRNRSARSAQGGAEMSVESSEAATPSRGSVQHSSAEMTLPLPVKAEAKASAPIIMLGVGVPASEL